MDRHTCYANLRKTNHTNRVNQFYHVSFFILIANFLLLHSTLVQASEFKQKLDVQLRADDRSNRHIRYQYRLRYYPQFVVNNDWSLNSFVVTGDEYGSSHNTLDDGNADYLYMRRLYLRHKGDYGKTEIGVVPTYKGRVSSSGLSKDGWIKGVRYVAKIGDDNFEFVVGELSTLDPSKALQFADKLDYVEVEYSANLNKQWSYEISAERMTGGNFLRTELRNQNAASTAVFAEFIARLDESKIKTVIGVEGSMSVNNYPMEYFAHYSYVSENFGLRAELTEDFLGTGHGIGGELAGHLINSRLDWFINFEVVDNSSRFQAGIKWSI